MKSQLKVLVVAAGLFCSAVAFSQTATPASTASSSMGSTAASSAPANKTGALSTAKTASGKVEAAGGGDGKVWVNAKSKTYHCMGTKYYGKTKAGAYMTEMDAKAKGNHALHGKACA